MSAVRHSPPAAAGVPPALRPFCEIPGRADIIGARLRLDWLRVHEHLLGSSLLEELRALERDPHAYRRAFDALDGHCVLEVMSTAEMRLSSAVDAYWRAMDGGATKTASVEAVHAMLARAGSEPHGLYLRKQVTSMRNFRDWQNGVRCTPARPPAAPAPAPRTFEEWIRGQPDFGSMAPTEIARLAFEGGLAEAGVLRDAAHPDVAQQRRDDGPQAAHFEPDGPQAAHFERNRA